MKKIRLESISTLGKIKFIELIADGIYLTTKWGYNDSDKIQETKEKCESKNIGKINEISAEKQALIQLERKRKKKIDEGYIEGLPAQNFGSKGVGMSLTKQSATPNFSNLQKHFCPCKPIAKPPKNCLDGTYLADRKYNGVNLIITKKDNIGHIYTRRVDDITEQTADLQEFEYILDNIRNDSMILVELICMNKNGNETPELLRGLINKKRSKKDVLEHYKEINKNGQIKIIVFDVMFWNGVNICNESFTKRRGILHSIMALYAPVQSKFDQKLIDYGEKHGWEGFVLRKPDSIIEYTMNGKAKRTGSWKWKFEETQDMIIIEVELGKGKHCNYWSRFKLGQFKKDGSIHNFGYAGPGQLTVKELEEFYKQRKNIDGSYNVKPYQVVEVKYRAKTKYDKLEFPVILKLRDDKPAKECIYEE